MQYSCSMISGKGEKTGIAGCNSEVRTFADLVFLQH